MLEYSYIYNELVRRIAINVIKTNVTKGTRESFFHAATNTEEYKTWEDLRLCVSSESYSAKCMLLNIVHKKFIYVPYLSRIQGRIIHFLEEMNNRFITPAIKREFISHYCKMKQVYWGFKKFARIWKIRKTPIRIQTDLYMNELDPTHPTTFQLVQDKGIYLFTFNNLVRIILEAITHQTGMFVEPLPIKNPYTNNALSKPELFNIYFGMRLRNMRIHELFEKCFRCEFNMFEFRRRHETELRDIAIDQYVKTATYPDLLQDVDDMLRTHKMTNKIKICPGFPLQKLVETMRPLLKLYILERYSFSSMTRKYSKAKLELELHRFAEYNPLYGRRTAVGYMTQPNANPFLQHKEYIRKEPSYVMHTNPYRNSYCYSKYMETHIYSEDIFDKYVDFGDSIESYVETISNTHYYARNTNTEPDNQTILMQSQILESRTMDNLANAAETEEEEDEDAEEEEDDEDAEEEEEDDECIIEDEPDLEMENDDGSIS